MGTFFAFLLAWALLPTPIIVAGLLIATTITAPLLGGILTVIILWAWLAA